VFYTQHTRTPDAHKISDKVNTKLCVPVYTKGGTVLSRLLVTNTHKIWAWWSNIFDTTRKNSF